MRIDAIPSATNNVYEYRIESSDGTIHEGFLGDGNIAREETYF